MVARIIADQDGEDLPQGGRGRGGPRLGAKVLEFGTQPAHPRAKELPAEQGGGKNCDQALHAGEQPGGGFADLLACRVRGAGSLHLR